VVGGGYQLVEKEAAYLRIAEDRCVVLVVVVVGLVAAAAEVSKL